MSEEVPKSDSEKHREHAPPYVAYKTFRNFTESLRAAMPSRIDRSVMHKLSGAAQSHILSALRSMNFVSNQGLTTEAFREFVNSEGEERQAALTAAIKVGFPFLFDGSIELSTATGKQLLEKFGSTPFHGNTLRRSVAFFLAAAKDARLTVSPYFDKIQSRSAASPRRSSSNNGLTLPYLTGEAEVGEGEGEGDEEDQESRVGGAPRVPLPAAESLTVELKSGGTITFTASTSFIKMSADDRAFVFDVIDQLQKYGTSA